MSFYQLPPAGNPVSLTAEPSSVAGLRAPSFFSGYQTQYYDSGTAALAAAICAAKKLKNCSAPEVILPAYACPDLVSAAVFANVKPVLVDLEADRPWLDLQQLDDAITENTLAVVAVSLFGIAERWSQLCELVKHKDIVLIEDSAQYFPGKDERREWRGDLVVLSFGRGKPVSLLGGGAVLTDKASLFERLPKPLDKVETLSERLVFSLKARLYNGMISPYVYWLPQSLPFLHLGETRYHKLAAIEGMDPVRSGLLACNISRYQNDRDATTRCIRISNMLDSLDCSPDRVKNLPRICDSSENRRLLRYPLLLEGVSRDQVYQNLRQAGLGASLMYPANLSEIAGCHMPDDRRSYPNAETFASSLITLPTHCHVCEADIEKMKTIFSDSVL